MKKIVVKLHLHEGKAKRKAFEAVSNLEGITSLSADSNGGKLIVTGDVDPVAVVGKLRAKKWDVTIESVEDVKKEEKKEEKKEDKKPEAAKKEEKNDDGKKKDVNEQLADYVKAYQNAYPHLTTHYCVHSMEENPNACVIC